MNQGDFTQWISDNALGVFVVVVVFGVFVGGVTLLVKLWPALTQTVSVMNNLFELPETNRMHNEMHERIEAKIDESIDRLGKVETSLVTMKTNVDKVNHEVHPNGGDSLRDDVTKLLGESVAQGERLEMTNQQVARLDKQFEDLKSSPGNPRMFITKK